jgi:N-acetyl-anhydromuramyl-L-alanine amidase AmpD
MRAPLSSFAVAALLLGLAPACAPREGGAPPSPDGPVAATVRAAADAHGLPADLLLAIAHVEGGLALPATREVGAGELVEVAGAIELRRGRLDTLALGAELTGLSTVDLQARFDAGTEAGARVVAELGRRARIDPARLAAWAPVVEELSGHLFAREREDYRARVFALLRAGGEVRARGGERVTIAPHPELPVGLALRPPPLAAEGQPEFPGATWFDTSCNNKCTTDRGGAEVSMIVVHDTEGGWDASVATLQNDPGKSVHYIIDADGSRVGQFIPESYTGWHAGNSYYNHRSVGIEHVGFAADDDYQTALYEKSAELVKSIVSRNAVPLDRTHVVGHQEVPNGNLVPQDSPPCSDSPASCCKNDDYGGANNHRDPGVHWEWCQYMALVGGSCKCNDAHDLWNCVHDLSEAVRCVNGVVEIAACPSGCVVQPNGVDDQCLGAAGGGGAGTGGAGTGGAGGATATTTTPAGGGAAPTTTSTATATGPSGAIGGDVTPPAAAEAPAETSSGCATRDVGAPREGSAVALAIAALALAARRRR